MKKIIIKESGGNYCRTQYNVNPESGSEYSGSLTEWDCGCKSYSGGAKVLCSKHTDLPPVLRQVEEPVKVDSLNCANAQYGDDVILVCSTEHLKKIRRRVEDSLRKAGDGQVLRLAEILGVKIN